MTVISGDESEALCKRRGETTTVSMLLVGAQAAGTHVLVHLGSAVRVLSSEEASLIDNALDGLSAALKGESFAHLFADLVDREPQLPDFLQGQE